MTSCKLSTKDNPSSSNYTAEGTEKARYHETIHEAVQWGDFDRVKEILEKDPEVVNSRADVKRSRFIEDSSEEDMAPLHVAVSYNRFEIAEYLITKGADIAAKSKKRRYDITAFRMAATRGRVDFLKLFLRHGVNVNEKGLEDSSTALHTATFYSQPYAAEILIKAGADINARNNEGWTPLHNTASSNRNPFLIELLIANGADINAQLEKCKERELDAECYPATGDTPLHIAARDGSSDTVKLLLCLGADMNSRNARGLTPLQVALERKRDTIAELLRQNGAIAEPRIAPPNDQPEQKTSYPPYQSQEHVFEEIYWVVDDTIKDLLVPAAEEHILNKQERDDFLSNAQRMINHALMASLIDELQKMSYPPSRYNITSDCRLVGDFRTTMSDGNLNSLFVTAEVCHKTILGELIKTMQGGGSR
ncbi:MAG: ankyrin repeat domain-containing protein [Vulcanimicrobiota bacterium]